MSSSAPTKMHPHHHQSAQAQQQQQQQHHRRRKKRTTNTKNVATRSVDVVRGPHGFGFTISGQQPCILSCIVENSPADLAGLRTGDFLVTVNGLNVAKLAHEAIVQLIASSTGTIRIAIAEHYYLDSSDEEATLSGLSQSQPVAQPKDVSAAAAARPARPKFLQHKLKTQQQRTHHQQQQPLQPPQPPQHLQPQHSHQSHHHQQHQLPSPQHHHHRSHSHHESPTKPCSTYPTAGHSAQSFNSDFHAQPQRPIAPPAVLDPPAAIVPGPPQQRRQPLEFSSVVGYLGTIEMPKQIATSSKLQTVRSCIRKLRQEKRTPTIVLMTILPSCLTLTDRTRTLLAKYPAARLSYVSNNSSEQDTRFFGLVTTAVHADGLLLGAEHSASAVAAAADAGHLRDVTISNSCHVFVVDPKMADHQAHAERAQLFRVQCTADPISQSCLEFPSSSEYTVYLIRTMYNLNCSTAAVGGGDIDHHQQPQRPARQVANNGADGQFRRMASVAGASAPEPAGGSGAAADPAAVAAANVNNGLAISPQPSNHSEVTTTSSNSDSGIGFHNDCTNISDRILVVDFPAAGGQRPIHVAAGGAAGPSRAPPPPNVRPLAISHDMLLADMEFMRIAQPQQPIGQHAKSKSLSSDRPNALLQLPGIMPAELQALRRQFEEYGDYPTGVPHSERAVDVPPNMYSAEQRRAAAQLAAHSCDDMLMNFDREATAAARAKMNRSIEDVSMMTYGAAAPAPEQAVAAGGGDVARPPEERTRRKSHVFLFPRPLKKSRPTEGKAAKTTGKAPKTDNSSFAAKVLAQQYAAQSVNDITLQQQQLHLQQKKKCTTPHCDSISSSLRNLCEASAHGSPLTKTAARISQMGSAYSEPDLASRALQNNAAVSPFRRWGQSSFRTRHSEQPGRDYTQRRASSSESDFYLKTMNDDRHGHQSASADGTSAAPAPVIVVNGPLSWGSSFEKLLDDISGLHTFAEFLKKEFSAENIYFWTACERYRQLDDADRSHEAEAIFAKHLAIGAAEPVNVDSQARTTAQDNLSAASGDLFAQTQKQIFNLMKFDSYQRFIRSDMYRRCVDAEENGLPLPYPGNEQPDVGLRTGPLHAATPAGQAGKLKKSLSNAEDRRRKSLLPWHRKQRCKSKDRQEGGGGGSDAVKSMLFASTSSIPKQLAAALAGSQTPLLANSDLASSRSSLSSFDAALSQRQHQHEPSLDGGTGATGDCKSCLCRVLLTDGATTIVQTRPNESIRELIERLLDKRAIVYRAFEAFLAGSNKPLPLDEPSTTIGGKEVTVDQRIVFKLDLPNRKVISVKSKTTKALEDVLRPILNKYNYRLDLVQVLGRDRSQGPLNMQLSVQETDGQRLQVVLKSSEMLDEEGPQTPTTPTMPVLISPSRRLPVDRNHYQNHHHYAAGPVSGHSPPAYLPPPVPYDLQQHPSAIVAAAAAAEIQNSHMHHSHHHHQQQQQQHQLHNNKNYHQQHGAGHQRQLSAGSLGYPSQQSHLDEINNELYSELRQEKVFAQITPNAVNSAVAAIERSGVGGAAAGGVETQSTRSADWDTESGSSLFDRLRRNNAKKMEFLSRGSAAVPPVQQQQSADADVGGGVEAGKRAKWKMQVTHKSENHDLLEGLKRAQRSRLEDQRGTEINFELPDFLKNKENFNKNKLRKIKPVEEPVPLARSKFDHDVNMATTEATVAKPAGTVTGATAPTSAETPANHNNNSGSCPQPAPRLSIGKTTTSPTSFGGAVAEQPIPTRRNSGAPLESSTAFAAADTSADCPSITFGSTYNAETSFASSCLMSQSTVSNATIASTVSDQSRQNSTEDPTNANVTADTIPEQSRGPPPLPPKPKVLPIKPSNWAGSHNNSIASSASTSSFASSASSASTSTAGGNHSTNGSLLGSPVKATGLTEDSVPMAVVQRNASTSSMSANPNNNNGPVAQSNIYLDQPSSSFV